MGRDFIAGGEEEGREVSLYFGLKNSNIICKDLPPTVAENMAKLIKLDRLVSRHAAML